MKRGNVERWKGKMKRLIAGCLLSLACASAQAEGAVAMVVTNFVTALDVPVVTNLVTITTTNTFTQVVTNAVPSPAVLEEERARYEEEARKRRIATRTFLLAHADALEVAERFNATWPGDFGVGIKIAKIAQAFPEANKVMVTAPGVILDACEEVIRVTAENAVRLFHLPEM